ncbi:MAG: hypothetical protein JSW07_10920, partial [bacterium]
MPIKQELKLTLITIAFSIPLIIIFLGLTISISSKSPINDTLSLLVGFSLVLLVYIFLFWRYAKLNEFD